MLTMQVDLADLRVPEGLGGRNVLAARACLANFHPDDERFQIEIRTSASNIVPELLGSLEIYPAEYGSESIMEIMATYETPPGMLGFAADTTLGYAIAQRAMAKFLAEVAERLKSPS